MASSSTTQDDTSKYSENSLVFNNWAQVASCKPQYYHEPTRLDDIIEVIAFATAHKQKIRVIGAGHSPSNIAFTNDHLISLQKYSTILGIDKEKNTVKVRFGHRF